MTLLALLMWLCRRGVVVIHVITRSLIRPKFRSSRNNDRAGLWLRDLPKPHGLEHRLRLVPRLKLNLGALLLLTTNRMFPGCTPHSQSLAWSVHWEGSCSYAVLTADLPLTGGVTFEWDIWLLFCLGFPTCEISSPVFIRYISLFFYWCYIYFKYDEAA